MRAYWINNKKCEWYKLLLYIEKGDFRSLLSSQEARLLVEIAILKGFIEVFVSPIRFKITDKTSQGAAEYLL